MLTIHQKQHKLHPHNSSSPTRVFRRLHSQIRSNHSESGESHPLPANGPAITHLFSILSETLPQEDKIPLLPSSREKLLYLLLHQPPYPSISILEKQIFTAFMTHFGHTPSYRNEAKLLEEAITHLKGVYGSTLRKDNRSPAIAHPLSVARDVAVLGGDVKAIILSLFHDIGEDYGNRTVKSISEKFNLHINGWSLSALISKMTYDHVTTYESYLNELYSDWGREIGVFMTTIKSLDGLENAKTIFEGMEKSHLNRQIEKAILHTRNWKKLNREVYEYMLELLRSKGVETNKIFHPTFAQAEATQSGVRVVRAINALSGNLLQLLPDKGSNSIIIYEPYPPDLYMHSSESSTISVEYSNAFLPKKLFHALLKKHFGKGTEIREIRDPLSIHLPLLSDPNEYVFDITKPDGFDSEIDTAFFRHIHKLSNFYPKWFFSSHKLFDLSLRLYDFLWKQIFYKD
ncbi:MAG: hypothetical protein QXW70_00335 [Candidatus Anstonellales archaeon]